MTDHDADAPVASIGVWVEAGSRDEAPEQAGASHFLEHLLFKGTPERSARAIAVAVDAVGGELNAYTTREYTAFVARVPAEAADVALDVLGDVVTVPAFRDDEVEAERRVILEELAMNLDSPEDVAQTRLAAETFPGHPLGREILGEVTTVSRLRGEDLAAYHRAAYRPERLIVAAAGAVDHARVTERLAGRFGSATGQGLEERTPPPPTPPSVTVVPRDGEQVHVAASWRTFAHSDPRRHALAVANQIVGGGPSSRLFQEVREERGLAYSVWSAPSLHSDVGVWSLAVGTAPEATEELLDVVSGLLAALVDGGVTADEVDVAKGYLRGATICGLEDSAGRMARAASLLAVDGEVVPVEAELAAIDAVTLDETVSVLRSVLSDPASVVAIGPDGAVDPRRLAALTS